MNILAINGSPSRQGQGAKIIQAIIEAAKDDDLEFDVVNLYEKKISGCMACDFCKKGPETACAIRDDMSRLYEKIRAAGVLVISSPIYMGQVSGPFKCFMDRFYAFVDGKFKVRDLPGKKLVIILTSGAPTGTYRDVAKYLKRWLGDFLKMVPVATIQAGNASRKAEVDPKVLAKAQRIGRSLAILDRRNPHP